MPTVTNKTDKPISIPLSGGKKLHLGPGLTGQVSLKAAARPGILKLVEAGDIEIEEKDARTSTGLAGAKKGRNATPSHISGSAIRRSGDR